MSSHRYTPELKDEAVRQVLDRGHGVASVAQGLAPSPLREDRVSAPECFLASPRPATP